MLVDMHAHTSGISLCCQMDASQIVKEAKKAGLDGIILTNHYQEAYTTQKGIDDLVERYIAEYHHTKACGEAVGIQVFFGLEVTVNFDPRVHLLVYGITEDYLRQNPYLFAMSQKELYETVHRGGGVLVQGHPFRSGCTVLDTDYLDGVEINCHPLYQNAYSVKLEEIAKGEGLMLTCGGDYHGDSPYRPRCGTYLPDDCKDIHDIKAYLETSKTAKLRIHEVGADTYHEKEYLLR